jgi:hypothetical protein
MGVRILFVGNSITRHAPKPEIGWNNDWGMAASVKENDYVHLIMKHVQLQDTNAEFCIAQVAAWEQEYWNERALEEYRDAVLFAPDIIIIKIGENVFQNHNEKYPFHLYYKKLVDFFNPYSKAKVIVVTSFWRVGVIDEVMRLAAAERAYPVVELGHLGERNEMKALSAPSAIANHPGDLGMAAIADTIWTALEQILIERTTIS